MNNRGRIQAQDDSLEESESWDTNNEITKQEGINKSNSLKSKLHPRDLRVRLRAFNKAEDLIQNAPTNGHPAQLIKTFSDSPQNRKIRVDVEVRNGKAFIDN